MEKALSAPHAGNTKSSSGSSAAPDRGNSARRVGSSGSHSPGSGAAAAAGSGNSDRLQQGNKRHLEGVLSKYTNLLQGWQNRYFVLDPEGGQLQYFVSEASRALRPRGSLPLVGASVSRSDEAAHMFTVYSANGELYKLRAADAREQQFWMSQLQACVRRHSESSAKVSSVPRPPPLAGRVVCPCSLPLSLPPPPPPSHTAGSGAIVTITHHRSPAAARRARSLYPGRLLEVREVMSQAEGQQRALVHSIESLPSRGQLSSLDQDLLLLKATSAATLSCLGECLNILQQNVGHVTRPGHAPATPPAWPLTLSLTGLGPSPPPQST
ncbi:hypothetical protein AAFF_G00183870 [Aldrovandia affinis]|uniref:PH domain-containing protein n=1 Tax=Aldrovandia affinis TaxID=143900 RepID=A0AAD7RK60_9TELE|nr:hypothetical protein AAFF_G00183870 [Aldrovandia affinis]